jgi:MFS family permease
VYTLGGVAQGMPALMLALELEGRQAGAGWLAALAIARLAPYVICSPVAGGVLVRVEPRRILLVTSLARAGLAAWLWIAVAAHASPSLLVASLFVLIAAGTPAYPALMRIIHDAVPASSTRRTLALAGGLEAASFVVGPAIGGLLVVAGASGAGLASSTLCLVAAGLTLAIPDLAGSESSGAPGQIMREALAWMLRPSYRVAIVAVVAVNTLTGLLAVVLVRLPSELGSEDDRYASMSIAIGIGSLVALAVLIGPLDVLRRPLPSLVVAGAATVLLATTDHPAIAMPACILLGGAVLTVEVLVTRTLAQAVTRPFVAPVFGLLDSWMVAAMSAGALAAPALQSAVGARTAVAAAGLTTALLAAGGLARTLRPVASRRLDGRWGRPASVGVVCQHTPPASSVEPKRLRLASIETNPT